MTTPQLLSLTPKLKARMKPWNDQWAAAWLSTEPADFDAAEAAISECYRFLELEPPARFVRVGSPLVCAVAGSIASGLLRGDEIDRAVDDVLDQTLGGMIRGEVERAVAGATDGAPGRRNPIVADRRLDFAIDRVIRGVVDSAIRRTVDHAAHETVSNAVERTFDRAVGRAVYETIEQTVGEAARGILSNWYHYMGGQFNALWHAYAGYFREVCGLDLPGDLWARARAFDRAECSCGSWYPHADFCIISDRMMGCSRNQRGRLHDEHGPVLRWRDGWSIHAIEGVRVPGKVVLSPEEQSIEEIDGESNEEVRRVRIERYGWLRYIEQSGATVSDTRFNEIDRQRECLMQLKDGSRRLVVSDPSTARIYALGVPREVQTCEQAQAFLNHGLRIIHRS